MPDDEWEILLGRPIPADTVKIDRNMTLGELNHSRSPLCWLVWAVLTMMLNASYKRGKPNLNVMFQYNMPLRALAKMTSGAISMGMVDGIVLEAKGFSSGNSFVDSLSCGRAALSSFFPFLPT